MSKIGKKNILIPKDSTVSFNGGEVTIKGPRGTQSLTIDDKIFSSKINDKNEFELRPKKTTEDKKVSLMWGTYRSLVKNALDGVSTGHEKILVLTGVGFRAALKGDTLNLQLGFSHDVNFKIPKDIKITVEKQTTIKINGINKDLVSKVASKIKSFKPVEPYKGKGIKEKNQYVLRKEGKKK